ncbi:MAG TPA: GldG family protein [Candidatus Polarisedimenticolia bacterium]|nr:GldG family protein [Candidatus Polarisedimenticolia bacterium]
MKILREYGGWAGALMVILAILTSLLAPERTTYILSVGGFGALLLVVGLTLNRARVLAVLKGRRARAAGASAGYVLTVLAVVVLVNFLAVRHNKRFDLTENAAFSLSEQTIKVLKALPREVSVTAFYREVEPTRQKLQDLLQEYHYRSPKLSVRYVDPDTNPGEAKRYGITEYGTIVVESGKQESRTNTGDEESLTNAIIKVTKDRERIVYVTTGHGERSLADGERGGLTLLKGELEKQHYTVKPLVLNQGVPADATLVIIPGPQKPLLEAEAKMVGDYLERGGHLFCLQDPGSDPGLQAVLARLGLRVRKDVVIDKVSQLFGGDARIPMVPADGYDETHPVTKTFRYQTFFPLASSIEIAATLPEGVTATKLAQTSQYSWGETNDAEFKSGHITFDEKSDTKGPVIIGAAATRKMEPKAKSEGAATPPPVSEARLLLFGDSDFISNAYFNASGNGDLTLNGVAWLAEQEDLVSIRPKTSTPRIVILTPAQVRAYFWSIVALAPIAITAVGVGIWARRKKL